VQIEENTKKNYRKYKSFSKNLTLFVELGRKNLLLDRLPKKNLYFFLKVQLKISLNPKFQNFRVTR
jgi:hypothetical protein